MFRIRHFIAEVIRAVETAAGEGAPAHIDLISRTIGTGDLLLVQRVHQQRIPGRHRDILSPVDRIGHRPRRHRAAHIGLP